MDVCKLKCIHCKKKIKVPPNQSYCPNCLGDIRSMWIDMKQTEDSKTEIKRLYCPNPDCRTKYTDVMPYCNNCGNDFTLHPPVSKADFLVETETRNRIYCPQCGAVNDNNNPFCDCGCDFKINPRIAVLPKKRVEFFCAICNTEKVSEPDGICPDCKIKEERRKNICPECKMNPVANFGDICRDCMRRKPLKGTGVGFHVVK